jgi:phenylacetate-CoA ligase
MIGLIKAHVIYPIFEKYLKRDIRSKLEILQKYRERPRKERDEIQKKRLHHVLSLAGTHVPYYRDLFKKLNFNPDEVLKDMSCLEKLPYLTKDIVNEQGDRMLNEQFDKSQLQVRKTGGSTGPSTLIYYNQDGIDWGAAVNLYVLGFTGRKHRQKEIHLSTEFFQKQPFKARITEKMKCLAMNRVNVYTHAFDDDTLRHIWKNIRRTRPYIIQGHPSTFYALATYSERHHVRAVSALKAIESTGETLDLKKLKAIERAFNTKVYNRLGSAEFGVVSHSREDPNKMEVINYSALVETMELDEGLKELVITGLTNEVMPLIRYRSGDLGELIDNGNVRFITNVLGRVHDLITINGKTYPTHYVQDVLDRVNGVDEFQIIEKSYGRYLLKLVANTHIDKGDVEKRVFDLFGEKILIEYTDFEGFIRQGWRDKFRYLAREL